MNRFVPMYVLRRYEISVQMQYLQLIRIALLIVVIDSRYCTFRPAHVSFTLLSSTEWRILMHLHASNQINTIFFILPNFPYDSQYLNRRQESNSMSIVVRISNANNLQSDSPRWFQFEISFANVITRCPSML